MRLPGRWLITLALVTTGGFAAAREPAATPLALQRLRASLASAASAPSRPLLDRALQAWSVARARGEVSRPVVALIDYSRPSREKRLWVLDLARAKVLFHELVAHGRGSGDDRATVFSDKEGSHASSLGVFRTGATYRGKHGYSLKLEGLEPGWNQHALSRSVVIHGASYVSDGFWREHGRLGRSWGCPAVREKVARGVIDALKGGALVLAWFPDLTWQRSSIYVRR